MFIPACIVLNRSGQEALSLSLRGRPTRFYWLAWATSYLLWFLLELEMVDGSLEFPDCFPTVEVAS